MTTVEEIEKAVANLAPEELARFRAWFEEYDGAEFDRKIERDAKAGKLDQFADAALVDLREGRAPRGMKHLASRAFWETYQGLPQQVRARR